MIPFGERRIILTETSFGAFWRLNRAWRNLFSVVLIQFKKVIKRR